VATVFGKKSKVFLSSLFILLSSSMAFGEVYKKSTEGKDVVKDKLYPKRGKLELDLPNGGLLLNESYIRTFLLSGGGAYFFNEEWGAGVDFSIGLNSDKPERACIENFYNDPNSQIDLNCGTPGDIPGGSIVNMGPAYVPIREIQSIVMANALWNPIYGKALMFMSGTIYFDLYLEGGLGMAMSKFYPKQEKLKNDMPTRGTYENKDGDADSISAEELKQFGADPTSETYAFGIEGRPTPVSQTNVLFNLGVGQKFHFAKKFHVKVFLRNMTLLGTHDGFENLFALYGGAGMRF
jgi:outer membrane beta-barrel protein